MRAEVAEQPAAWSRLLDDRSEVESIAAALAGHPITSVQLLARGTSDHAALHAKYLVETRLGLPAGLMSPSSTTLLGGRPDLRGVAVLAVSQSGGSPDLVSTLALAGELGAITVALTNAADSELARAAQLHVDVQAGPELAVAATKSYTCQLLALTLLCEAWAERRGVSLDPLPVTELPVWGEETLAALGDGLEGEVAARFRYTHRIVLTGRGHSSASAAEAALKLMETSRLSAQAFSGADLLHGPLALLGADVPVVAFVDGGPTGAAMREVLQRVRAQGAEAWIIGHDPGLDTGPVRRRALPDGVPHQLAPMLEIVPAQALALELALLRGHDPDAPEGLAKVTRTL